MGAGRGIVNSTIKPAAGLMGLVVYPLEGGKKAIETAMKRGNRLPSTRVQDGLDAVKTVSREEINTILVRFERLKWLTKERQKGYNTMMKGL